jgi:hypothetical protein
MKDLVRKAERLAFEAHKGQVRKGDGSPYFEHPKAVAMKLMEEKFPAQAVAAAFVHDVLEDTEYPEGQLEEELGREVVEIVKTVTQDGSLPWWKKKRKYIETVRNGSELAKAVCVADKIHNLKSLLAAYSIQGEALWKKFNACRWEKLLFEQEVLEMLTETWDHPLIGEYRRLIEQFEKIDREESRFALSEEGFLFDTMEFKTWSPSQKAWISSSLTLGVMLDSTVVSPNEAARLMASSQALKEPPAGETDRVKDGLRYRVDLVDLFHSSTEEGYTPMGHYKTGEEAVKCARDFTDENLQRFKGDHFMNWRMYGEAALVYDLETGKLVWDGVKYGEKMFQK